MDNYDLVPSGLIKLIKQGFNLGVDHAGTTIGQPTTFFVGCALNLLPQDPANEIKNLRRKLRAGADFILTQPIFEPQKAQEFLKLYEAEHGPLPIPLLVGILPLANARHASFLHHEVPGITIPDEIRDRLDRSSADSYQAGIEIAAEIIQQVKSWANGVYLMPPFNRYDMAADLIERVRSE
jgi:methionine synthase / methylenetetrahydrofolate reductase(NADPH)